jgi:hypothetical protein
MWNSRLRGCIGQPVIIEGRNFVIEGALGRVEDGAASFWSVSGQGMTIVRFRSGDIADVFDLPALDRCVLKIVLR